MFAQKRELKEENINLRPDDKSLRNKFLASDLIQQYGYGDFLVQFRKGESLIAEKSYKVVDQQEYK